MLISLLATCSLALGATQISETSQLVYSTETLDERPFVIAEASVGVDDIWLAPATAAPNVTLELMEIWRTEGSDRDYELNADELLWVDAAIGERLWVLPEDRPTLMGTVTSAWARVVNEETGAAVVELEIDVDLPPGTPIVAFSRDEPPASWQFRPPPIRANKKLKRSARSYSRENGFIDPEIQMSRRDGVRVIRVSEVLAEGGTDVLDLLWDGDRLTPLGREQTTGPVSEPWTVRDLDGDGSPELLYRSCGLSTRSVDGEWELETTERDCR